MGAEISIFIEFLPLGRQIYFLRALVQMNRNDPRFRTIRRPFWLPASKFYFLSAAMAMGIFFLVWLILQEGHDETPWITAGLAASLFLIAAVIVREVVLRNVRNRMVTARQQLDRSLAFAPKMYRSRDTAEKLTLERNKAFVAEIRRKSDAAKVLSSVSGSHREVFELCAYYLDLVERELPNVGIGSPRLAALNRGKETALRFHRYHMLQWAESEVRNHTSSEGNSAKWNNQLENAERAYNVIQTALAHYPSEVRLIDSESAIREHLDLIRMSAMVEKGERAASKGDRDGALAAYREALVLSETIADNQEGRKLVIESIEAGIRRLDGLLR